MKTIYLSIIIAIALSSCAPSATITSSSANPYRVILTTALGENNTPVNDVSEISIKEKRVYIYVNWLLPMKEHVLLTKITDGAGNVVRLSEVTITPQKSSWNTWSSYNINPKVDRSGKWKFEIYLNGDKKVEKYLFVTSE